MPAQNPVTRLEQVARGLGQLAKELESYTGESPKNLLWWRQEILEVAAELQRSGELREGAR